MQERMRVVTEGRSLVDRITEALADRIVAGVLPAGAPLRQDHLAAEFGASHVPVREAFRRLEAQGLVRSEPRRGVRVAPIDTAAVLEVTEMRAALEALALRHAVPRLGAAEIAAAEAALAAAEGSRDLKVWDAANRQFHRTLVEPCGMPRLIAAIDDLHQAAARFLHATWAAFERQSGADAAEHRAILTAAAAGQADEACRLLAAHIIDAGRALIGRLEPAVKAQAR